MDCLTLGTVWYTVLFIFFVLLVFGHYRLDAMDFDSLQDLERENFEKQAGEQGKLSLSMLNLCSFSL
jgi:hypothetical protein